MDILLDPRKKLQIKDGHQGSKFEFEIYLLSKNVICGIKYGHFLRLTNGGHFELMRKFILVIITRVTQYVQAKFCPTG